MIKKLFKPLIPLCCLFLTCLKCLAGVEITEAILKGNQLEKDAVLMVEDQKIHSSLFVWSNITNISVNNVISLKVLGEKVLPQDFECKLKLRVEYFTSPVLENPTVIDEIELGVDYKKAGGESYKGADHYKFKNGYHVKVYITEITNPQAVENLLLSSTIIIDRKYRFLDGQSPTYSN